MLQIDAWLQPVLDKEPRVDRLAVMAALPLHPIFPVHQDRMERYDRAAYALD